MSNIWRYVLLHTPRLGTKVDDELDVRLIAMIVYAYIFDKKFLYTCIRRANFSHVRQDYSNYKYPPKTWLFYINSHLLNRYHFKREGNFIAQLLFSQKD